MSTDRLKILLDDMKNRIRVAESKIELHSSVLECNKNDIARLNERKDNTDNLKQNYLQFAENFNSTVKNLHMQMDINKDETKQQIALQDDKRNDLRIDLEKKIADLNGKVEKIEKTLEV